MLPLNLRSHTPARVSLSTTGHSIATGELLEFQLAHAQARDAVHAALHLASFTQRLHAELPVLGLANISIVPLRTNAADRAAYLRHPNLGRTLDSASAELLQPSRSDLAIVIADGLSALAVERNAIPLLAHLLPPLIAENWRLAPLILVQQARVAIGDPIGHILGASLSLVLIGERPGLSSPDSLGAYMTWNPNPDCTDADRNCISNIREGGLAPEAAVARVLWYLQAARAHRLTGTALKESSLPLAVSLSKGLEGS